MLQKFHAFSGFSVSDLDEAKTFYELIGVKVTKTKEGLSLDLPGAGNVFIYPSSTHQAGSFTILNFVVEDIDKAVDELTKKGIQFVHYGEPYKTDEHGIARGLAAGIGPDIAWFKDPSGNFLSVLQAS